MRLWFAMIVQGFSVGLVFNPMTVMAYTTLSSQLRGEGTAMQSLARNIGSAIGISVTSFTLSRAASKRTHADIAVGDHAVRPGAAGRQRGVAPAGSGDAARRGAAEQIVNQQAAIIAYNNDFRLMMLTIVPPMLLLLIMRRHARPNTAAAAGD